jgi:hypothetical protein
VVPPGHDALLALLGRCMTKKTRDTSGIASDACTPTVSVAALIEVSNELTHQMRIHQANHGFPLGLER